MGEAETWTSMILSLVLEAAVESQTWLALVIFISLSFSLSVAGTRLSIIRFTSARPPLSFLYSAKPMASSVAGFREHSLTSKGEISLYG